MATAAFAPSAIATAMSKTSREEVLAETDWSRGHDGASNETARRLGWIKGYDELHKAAKQASG